VKRTEERNEFLASILVSAIEHAGYGFPGILKYSGLTMDADSYAVIYDRYEETPDGSANWAPKQTWRIDVDTIAKGIGILRKRNYPGTRDLIEADRENDATEIDVVGALAIVEAALFGDVVYC
jgi:hypothetical protein